MSAHIVEPDTTQKIGLVMFWTGAAYMFCASWLAMWWIAPIWRDTPAEQFEGTVLEFGGLVFTIIALSVPVGIVMTAFGMALYSRLGKADPGRILLLVAGLIVVAASLLFPPTLAYYPTLFGVIGGVIVMLFFMTLWYWARIRLEFGGENKAADIFQLFSHIFFFLTASTLCALLGNPFSGLFFPEKVLQDAALPYHYSMGTKIAAYLVLGWLFTFLAQYARYRIRIMPGFALSQNAPERSAADKAAGASLSQERF